MLAERLYEEGRRIIRLDEPDSAYRYTPLVVNPIPLAPIAREIRTIIKNGDLSRTALTNVHLFTASRAENYFSITKPALEKGLDVIQARSWWSTLVYQEFAEGYDQEMIEKMTRMSLGDDYMSPDFLYLLDINDEEERTRRITARGELKNPDTFESRDETFQQSLIDGYRMTARKLGAVTIDAAQPKATIVDFIWNDLHASAQ